MSTILFSIIFLFLCNWVVVRSLKGLFAFRALPISRIRNNKIEKRLHDVSGISFDLYRVKSTWLFAMATGLPTFKPTILISTEVLSTFSDNELEWMLFHEAGHVKLWHPAIIAIVQFGLLILGILLVWQFNLSFLSTSILLIGLVILQYQLNRELVERKADEFSLAHLKDPKGMITANQKMKAKGTSIFYKNPVLTYLFTPHLTYDERIRMAQKKL